MVLSSRVGEEKDPGGVPVLCRLPAPQRSNEKGRLPAPLIG